MLQWEDLLDSRNKQESVGEPEEGKEKSRVGHPPVMSSDTQFSVQK